VRICVTCHSAHEKKTEQGISDFSNIRAFFSHKKTSSERFLSVNHPRNLLLARKSDMLRTNAQAMMLLSRSVGRSVVHEVKDDNRFHKQNDGV